MAEENKTPDQILAEEIVSKLVSESLVPPKRSDVLLSKLLTGVASESDWRSWVDTAHIGGKRAEEKPNAQ